MAAPMEVALVSDAAGPLCNCSVWELHSGSALPGYRGGNSGPRGLALLGGEHLLGAQLGKSYINVWELQRKVAPGEGGPGGLGGARGGGSGHGGAPPGPGSCVGAARRWGGPDPWRAPLQPPLSGRGAPPGGCGVKPPRVSDRVSLSL